MVKIKVFKVLNVSKNKEGANGGGGQMSSHTIFDGRANVREGFCPYIVTACISFAGSFSDLRYGFFNRHCSSSKRNVCVIHTYMYPLEDEQRVKP